MPAAVINKGLAQDLQAVTSWSSALLG